MSIPDDCSSMPTSVSGGPRLLEWNATHRIAPLVLDEARVWIVELDQPADGSPISDYDSSNPRFASLSTEEIARASRFIRPRDRLRFARCRTALRLILGQLVGLPAETLRFRHTGSGKPELDLETMPDFPGSSAPLRFNVSHSSNLGLIAVCHGRELGVDIERVRTIAEADRIVASYFTPSELSEFALFAPQDKDLAFHRGWTRKEAIIKAEGTGLAGLATSFETHFGANELPTGFTLAQPFPRVNRWTLWEVAPARGFVAAVAIQTERP